MSRGARVARLRADRIYRTPSGRLCRWLPKEGDTGLEREAEFAYLRTGNVAHRHGDKTDWNDQFKLTRPVYVLLCEVGEHHATTR